MYNGRVREIQSKMTMKVTQVMSYYLNKFVFSS